ncbi:MAG: hypothetical protein F4110_12610 [Acidimicrobiaceae bacterium]|nr:hypothetical protein [Acidimicrobiaceae bacterium]MXZ98486.1 hypothetical protein [Acidimicrobiaceae bacterium]MYE96037.1 hypothetical protein [Acidimicrobiaceae bacterium]MYH42534.1 hypothetical protein [Acidimicrobiaceae bacterium]MYI54798.1 hypothetical protein [Acidimicrobiaceae bacterium]
MATTQAQRASLFNTLAELMGTEDAETLMQQLPPGGWDRMATKDDLQVLGATFTAALAEFRVEVTNTFAEFRVEVANGFAEAAKERAEIIKAFSDRHSELVKSQARHLYITVSTICLATISIWIALLAGPGAG